MEAKTDKGSFGRIILIVAGLIGGIYLLKSCFSSTSGISSTSNNNLPVTTIRDNVKIQPGSSYEIITSIGSVLVTGEVKNISDETYKYVKIRSIVYDSAGNQIGTNYSYLDSDVLPPGATSTFSVYVDCNTAQVAKVKSNVEE